MSFIIKEKHIRITYQQYTLYDCDTTKEFTVEVRRNYMRFYSSLICYNCNSDCCIHCKTITKMILSNLHHTLYKSVQNDVLNKLLK